MEFFKTTPQIDFLSRRYSVIVLSSLLFLFSIGTMSLKGIAWGLEFTGGTQLVLECQKPISLAQLKFQLNPVHLSEVQLQEGSGKTLRVTLTDSSSRAQTRILNALHQIDFPVVVKQIDAIGPQAGKALLLKGIGALLLALAGIMVYISLRFNYRFALGAAVALLHDPIVIMGLFSFWQIEFNLLVIAAILTVIGYSLNNIIVIFDRIRENFRRLKRQNAITIINHSINETLSRSLITSGVTFSIVLILYVFGGALLRNFALALIIGILVGSYSAITIASALLVFLGLDRHHVMLTPKFVDNRP